MRWPWQKDQPNCDYLYDIATQKQELYHFVVTLELVGGGQATMKQIVWAITEWDALAQMKKVVDQGTNIGFWQDDWPDNKEKIYFPARFIMSAKITLMKGEK